MWTGPDHEAYVCLTAHWLDESWVYRHALLDIYLCTDRHLGENLRDWILQILKDNDISVCCLQSPIYLEFESHFSSFCSL